MTVFWELSAPVRCINERNTSQMRSYSGKAPDLLSVRLQKEEWTSSSTLSWPQQDSVQAPAQTADGLQAIDGTVPGSKYIVSF